MHPQMIKPSTRKIFCSAIIPFLVPSSVFILCWESCDRFVVNNFPGMKNVALPIEKRRQMFHRVGGGEREREENTQAFTNQTCLNFFPVVKSVELKLAGVGVLNITSPQSSLLSIMIARKGSLISLLHVEHYINSERHLGLAFFSWRK